MQNAITVSGTTETGANIGILKVAKASYSAYKILIPIGISDDWEWYINYKTEDASYWNFAVTKRTNGDFASGVSVSVKCIGI